MLVIRTRVNIVFRLGVELNLSAMFNEKDRELEIDIAIDSLT